MPRPSATRTAPSPGGPGSRPSPATRRRRPHSPASDAALSDADRVLAGWARRVVGDPNGVTAEHVEELRRVGYDDGQVFSITLFVALRLAFSTVNDALGAPPDAELVGRAPAAVRSAVTFGRAPAEDA